MFFVLPARRFHSRHFIARQFIINVSDVFRMVIIGNIHVIYLSPIIYIIIYINRGNKSNSKILLAGAGPIWYKERRSIQELSAYRRDEGKTGYLHAFRAILLIVGAAFLGWYGKQGANNPFAGARTISVEGGADAYAVTCAAGRDTARASAPTGAVPPTDSLPPDSPTGAVTWKTVYPFADSAAAVLLTLGRSSALICDSTVFAPRPDDDAPQPRFREKLDLLVIPPAAENDAIAVRNKFRPRLIAVMPPCATPPTQNIICGPVDENGGFRYNFIVHGEKLKTEGTMPINKSKKSKKSNNNMEGTKPLIMEGTRPLRGQPYPTL